jgi:hypothetical protein
MAKKTKKRTLRLSAADKRAVNRMMAQVRAAKAAKAKGN